MSIEVRNVWKHFGEFTALAGVSLKVETGRLTALLGPSGSGKTTLLRIIAGLETPDAGRVLFSGAEATHVHARERNVGFVFQHYALFRHMTVFENIAFGLRVKPRYERPSENDIRSRVMALLKLVQLAQPAPQILAHLGVECAEGLVEQQHAGLDRQRARQCDALALAARQLVRVAVGQPVELHHF